MNDFSRNFFVCLFCFAGSSLTVVNKELVSVFFPYPGTLTFVQCLFAATLLHLGRIFIPSVEKNVQSINIETTKKWSILVLLFVLMLLSSMFALEKISVTTLTVVRNLTTITTATCDFFFLNTTFTLNRVLCLVAMLVGACMYGLHDMSFHAVGYLFLVANCVATTMYQIKVKVLVRELELSALSMSYYNNVLCLPALSAIVLLSGEVKTVIPEQLNLSRHCVLLILISSVLGFTLSITAFRLNQLVSATAIMVINNASKFLLIVYSEVFMTRSLGNLSAFGCAIVLTSSFLYSWLPNEVSSSIAAAPTAFNFLRFSGIIHYLFFFSIFVMFIFNALFYSKSPVFLWKSLEKLKKDEKFRAYSWNGNAIACNFDFCENISQSLSFHKCIGHGVSSRSCIFHSIAYNTAHEKFEYFNPLKDFVVYTENHSTMHDFSANFVSLKPMKHRQTKFWTVERLREQVPVNIPSKCIFTQRMLFWQSMARMSIGHTLADDLFGSFRVLSSLGLNPFENISVVLHEKRCETTKVCATMAHHWHPSISSEPIQYWEEILKQKNGCSRILFKELIVGAGGSGIMHGNLRYESRYSLKVDNKPIGNRLLGEAWLKFRNQVFKKLDLDPFDFPVEHQIVIFNKTRTDALKRKILSGRSIQNLGEIHTALSQAFPFAVVKVRDPSTFNTFDEEVKEMGKTTILISPPGSVQFTAIFLPPGAFLIGIDACLVEGSLNCITGNGEIEHIFSHIGYLNTLRYTRKGSKNMILEGERVKSLVQQAILSFSYNRAGGTYKHQGTTR